MKIFIEFIPIEQMRYSTVGDYFTDENGDLQIRIVDMDREIHSAAILIHELVECFLLRNGGKVTEKDIDDFDFAFEEKVKRGEVDENAEPGMEEDCPYRQEHQIATSCEMAMITLAGESWKLYEEAIYKL